MERFDVWIFILMISVMVAAKSVIESAKRWSSGALDHIAGL
jgi:hypothetical protein